jgi:hypothetical protein
MRAIFSVVFLLIVGMSSGSAFAAAGKCGAGKITCAQWCAKYRPGPSNCMSGHPNSCDKKRGGANACVGDVGR